MLETLGSPKFAAVANKTLAAALAGLPGSDLREIHTKALLVNGLVVLDALRRLYQRHAQSEKYQLVEQLSGAVRRTQGSLAQLGLDWPQFYPVAAAVYRCQRTRVSASVGVKLTGGGRGGSVVCVVPLTTSSSGRSPSEFLAEFEAALRRSEAASSGDPTLADVHVDWCSWLDLPEQDGLRMERVAGEGDMVGIPIPARLPYYCTDVEFVVIEVDGAASRVAERREENCGPIDMGRLRGSGAYPAEDLCDLFIACDPRRSEAAIFAWGHEIDLEASKPERHGTRQYILAMALAALSGKLSIPQIEAHAICDRLYPSRRRGSHGWTRRLIKSRLISPFNEAISYLSSQAVGRPQSSKPVLSLLTAHRGAAGGEYDEYNFSIALRGSGDGALRIGVANSSYLRSLLPPSPGQTGRRG